MDSSYQSATRLALALREGECSAAALLDETLARVDERNPAINAVVATCREDARSRAREADAAAARGELWGPLHGVPMTVKDTYEVAGMPATAGAPRFRDHYPQGDAVAVQRLLDAGAVIYGKTNTPLFAGDLQTYNEVYGVTCNPWNPGRTCGGSSGGSAAALAAGLTPLELGSDIGGSIRTPAAFCGVCGHKPSYGVIPKRGHIPGPPGTLARVDISVAGPMARSVADLELALGILAGPDPAEGVGWQLHLPPARHQRLSDFRVAAWLDDPACPVDADVVSVLQELVAWLRTAGAEVDTQARPEGIELASSHATYYQLLTAAMSGGLSPRVFAGMLEQAEAADPDDDGYAAAFARGATQRHADWQRADERRQHMRRAWQAFFGEVDILLCPVVHTPPFPHDHRQPMAERRLAVNGADRPYMDVLAWAGLAGVVYLPATVVPAGYTPDGLPVGVQIVGPYLEDYTALAFARHVEALTGGFAVPPGYGEAPS
ncbi:amidase [Aquisalimonas lutea]|uniref:amidase n=1 Tax=Aquisalimonas lutea TaxID=1327750 RepID=UPI0025B480CA|nr:amidase [Aquisalimonas lutea]MDN3517726.1 amidase [Aquisalimonas lutea]